MRIRAPLARSQRGAQDFSIPGGFGPCRSVAHPERRLAAPVCGTPLALCVRGRGGRGPPQARPPAQVGARRGWAPLQASARRAARTCVTDMVEKTFTPPVCGKEFRGFRGGRPWAYLGMTSMIRLYACVRASGWALAVWRTSGGLGPGGTGSLGGPPASSRSRAKQRARPDRSRNNSGTRAPALAARRPGGRFGGLIPERRRGANTPCGAYAHAPGTPAAGQRACPPRGALDGTRRHDGGVGQQQACVPKEAHQAWATFRIAIANISPP